MLGVTDSKCMRKHKVFIFMSMYFRPNTKIGANNVLIHSSITADIYKIWQTMSYLNFFNFRRFLQGSNCAPANEISSFQRLRWFHFSLKPCTYFRCRLTFLQICFWNAKTFPTIQSIENNSQLTEKTLPMPWLNLIQLKKS